jgi:hypothetical protein
MLGRAWSYPLGNKLGVRYRIKMMKCTPLLLAAFLSLGAPSTHAQSFDVCSTIFTDLIAEKERAIGRLRTFSEISRSTRDGTELVRAYRQAAEAIGRHDGRIAVLDRLRCPDFPSADDVRELAPGTGKMFESLDQIFQTRFAALAQTSSR